jgi:hypothetical protein
MPPPLKSPPLPSIVLLALLSVAFILVIGAVTVGILIFVRRKALANASRNYVESSASLEDAAGATQMSQR